MARNFNKLDTETLKALFTQRQFVRVVPILQEISQYTDTNTEATKAWMESYTEGHDVLEGFATQMDNFNNQLKLFDNNIVNAKQSTMGLIKIIGNDFLPVANDMLEWLTEYERGSGRVVAQTAQLSFITTMLLMSLKAIFSSAFVKATITLFTPKQYMLLAGVVTVLSAIYANVKNIDRLNKESEEDILLQVDAYDKVLRKQRDSERLIRTYKKSLDKLNSDSKSDPSKNWETSVDIIQKNIDKSKELRDVIESISRLRSVVNLPIESIPTIGGFTDDKYSEYRDTYKRLLDVVFEEHKDSSAQTEAIQIMSSSVRENMFQEHGRTMVEIARNNASEIQNIDAPETTLFKGIEDQANLSTEQVDFLLNKIKEMKEGLATNKPEEFFTSIKEWFREDFEKIGWNVFPEIGERDEFIKFIEDKIKNYTKLVETSEKLAEIEADRLSKEEELHKRSLDYIAELNTATSDVSQAYSNIEERAKMAIFNLDAKTFDDWIINIEKAGKSVDIFTNHFGENMTEIEKLNLVSSRGFKEWIYTLEALKTQGEEVGGVVKELTEGLNLLEQGEGSADFLRTWGLEALNPEEQISKVEALLVEWETAENRNQSVYELIKNIILSQEELNKEAQQTSTIYQEIEDNYFNFYRIEDVVERKRLENIEHQKTLDLLSKKHKINKDGLEDGLELEEKLKKLAKEAEEKFRKARDKGTQRDDKLEFASKEEREEYEESLNLRNKINESLNQARKTNETVYKNEQDINRTTRERLSDIQKELDNIQKIQTANEKILMSEEQIASKRNQKIKELKPSSSLSDYIEDNEIKIKNLTEEQHKELMQVSKEYREYLQLQGESIEEENAELERKQKLGETYRDILSEGNKIGKSQLELLKQEQAENQRIVAQYHRKNMNEEELIEYARARNELKRLGIEIDDIELVIADRTKLAEDRATQTKFEQNKLSMSGLSIAKVEADKAQDKVNILEEQVNSLEDGVEKEEALADLEEAKLDLVLKLLGVTREQTNEYNDQLNTITQLVSTFGELAGTDLSSLSQSLEKVFSKEDGVSIFDKMLEGDLESTLSVFSESIGLLDEVSNNAIDGQIQNINAEISNLEFRKQLARTEAEKQRIDKQILEQQKALIDKEFEKQRQSSTTGGILQGATLGASIGGVTGAVIGGVGGLIASILGSSGLESEARNEKLRLELDQDRNRILQKQLDAINQTDRYFSTALKRGVPAAGRGFTFEGTEGVGEATWEEQSELQKFATAFIKFITFNKVEKTFKDDQLEKGNQKIAAASNVEDYKKNIEEAKNSLESLKQVTKDTVSDEVWADTQANIEAYEGAISDAEKNLEDYNKTVSDVKRNWEGFVDISKEDEDPLWEWQAGAEILAQSIQDAVSGMVTLGSLIPKTLGKTFLSNLILGEDSELDDEVTKLENLFEGASDWILKDDDFIIDDEIGGTVKERLSKIAETSKNIETLQKGINEEYAQSEQRLYDNGIAAEHLNLSLFKSNKEIMDMWRAGEISYEKMNAEIGDYYTYQKDIRQLEMSSIDVLEDNLKGLKERKELNEDDYKIKLEILKTEKQISDYYEQMENRYNEARRQLGLINASQYTILQSEIDQLKVKKDQAETDAEKAEITTEIAQKENQQAKIKEDYATKLRRINMEDGDIQRDKLRTLWGQVDVNEKNYELSSNILDLNKEILDNTSDTFEIFDRLGKDELELWKIDLANIPQPSEQDIKKATKIFEDFGSIDPDKLTGDQTKSLIWSREILDYAIERYNLTEKIAEKEEQSLNEVKGQLENIFKAETYEAGIQSFGDYLFNTIADQRIENLLADKFKDSVTNVDAMMENYLGGQQTMQDTQNLITETRRLGMNFENSRQQIQNLRDMLDFSGEVEYQSASTDITYSTGSSATNNYHSYYNINTSISDSIGFSDSVGESIAVAIMPYIEQAMENRV